MCVCVSVYASVCVCMCVCVFVCMCACVLRHTAQVSRNTCSDKVTQDMKQHTDVNDMAEQTTLTFPSVSQVIDNAHVSKNGFI